MTEVYQVFAPAKINLGLRVLGKRNDGYHDLETVFYPLKWADTLAVSKSPVLQLECSDATLDCGEKNLVIRAARTLAAATGHNPEASIFLEKVLPRGAGLGGGSSDAASTLMLLSRLWNVSIEGTLMKELALSLGSDVPYFLNPVPSYGTSRGEKLTPLREFRLPYALVIVVPNIHVSTCWAFGRITPRADRPENLAAVVQSCDLDQWAHVLVNDFEAPVFNEYPVLRAQKLMMLDMGAGFSSMTGTGSAVYGVFEKWKSAQAAAEAANDSGHLVFSQQAG